MMKRAMQLSLIFSFSGFVASLFASQPMRASVDVRKLLSESPVIESSRSLGVLFGIGDERIQNLVQALDDPNKSVGRNAQVVIRYLGNKTGMEALIEKYRKNRSIILAGTVPLPLREWDYEYVRKYYLSSSGRWDQSSTSYIYALALDGSPEANTLLSELNLKVERGILASHPSLQRVAAIQSQAFSHKGTDVTKLVIDNAFFLDSDRRNDALGKLIGFNHAKDKALIEVIVGGAPLSEEVYHVVLQKHGENWTFFSIRRVTVS